MLNLNKYYALELHEHRRNVIVAIPNYSPHPRPVLVAEYESEERARDILRDIARTENSGRARVYELPGE
jgi:hypothetical protein